MPLHAVDSDIAAHALRQALGNRQPNAGAGRRTAAVLVLDLIIHGEDFVLLILRNPHAGVFHLKHQPILLFAAYADHDLPLRRELHRIADQVP
ncbi:hypothetical protein D3C76_1386300 [compost metagenome]